MNQFEIGVVGGGQLGRMMILEGHRTGLTFAVMDPSPDCPSAVIAHQFFEGGFNDATVIEKLAAVSRRLTFEFEHIDAATLMRLETTGCQVMPSPETLHMVQDKFRQKSFLASCALPIPEFSQVKTIEDVQAAADQYGYPLMLKSCTGGYDGKGNALISTAGDIPGTFNSLEGSQRPLMAERCIDFLMEISVLVARDQSGNLAVFPVGQNIHKNSILSRTIVPAPLPASVIRQAETLAKETMEQLKGIGIFCIEMFVDQRYNLSINEIAPRTHNSGHHTIESCSVSQFGQQIRALMGWPLAEPVLRRPAVMINLLGDPKKPGRPRLHGISDAMGSGEVYPHLYGKTESRPGRKMGHVTILGDTLEQAQKTADKVEACLFITTETDDKGRK